MSVIWIVGAPATGKSVLRTALARTLDLPAYGIDDERLAIMAPGEHWPANDALAWRSLAAKVAGSECCILETSGLSGRERSFLAGRDALVLLCVSSPAARARRLLARRQCGYRFAAGNRHYVRDTMRIAAPAVRPNLTVDSTHGFDLAPIAARVEAFIRRRAA